VKYCVLCRAEYRESVAICATCRTALVHSLNSEEALANPSRLLWKGKDEREFEFVASAIRDAEIPAFVEERPAGIGGFARSESQIHVLSRGFHRALAAAAEAIQSADQVHSPTQTCYACTRQCSAFLAACPFCKAVLIVEQTKSPEAVLSSPGQERSLMKYCPLCDAEYSEAHERCTVCGVDLVPEELRGRPLDERQRKERIELVWRGGDPGAVSEVIEVLRTAGICHHVQATNDHFVFELGMPRPKYVVRAFASDAAKAKELLAGIHDSSPFVAMEPSALALADEPLEKQPARKHEWRPAAATLEIWSGEDAALAQLLQACLRENGIGVARQGKPPGIVQLRVMPSDESAAREIIREVREASPPA
jgi:hypothetical protein